MVPNYYNKTGKLAFARIVYNIANTYQPLKDVTAVLKVRFEDELVEETGLISLPTLDVGTTTGNQTYVPAGGWQHATYNFKIELYVQGELYAQSQEVKMSAEAVEVSATPTPTPPAVSTPLNVWLIVGIIGGVGVIVTTLIAVLTRRRIR